MPIKIWQYLPSPIRKKRKTSDGFTLIELLVSIIVASMATTGLLYVSNELIRLDRREERLETVQRNMQRAMAYISDELKEAVHIYPDPTFITNQLTAADLPTSTAGSVVPILAFWKPESLSAREFNNILPADCTTIPDPDNNRINCQSLKLRQSYYSLVVYFAVSNADNSPNWEGQARIVRYVLPQYTQANLATVTETPGYAPPNNNFANWTPEIQLNASGSPVLDGSGNPVTLPTDGNWSVLVDYLDALDSVYRPLVEPANTAAAPPDLAGGCSQFGDEYTRSPPGDVATMESASFLACVKDFGAGGIGRNQDVVVFVRGNTKTEQQEIASPTPALVPGSLEPSQSVLPALQTQVLLRGATNKNP